MTKEEERGLEAIRMEYLLVSAAIEKCGGDVKKAKEWVKKLRGNFIETVEDENGVLVTVRKKE